MEENSSCSDQLKDAESSSSDEESPIEQEHVNLEISSFNQSSWTNVFSCYAPSLGSYQLGSTKHNWKNYFDSFSPRFNTSLIWKSYFDCAHIHQRNNVVNWKTYFNHEINSQKKLFTEDNKVTFQSCIFTEGNDDDEEATKSHQIHPKPYPSHIIPTPDESQDANHPSISSCFPISTYSSQSKSQAKTYLTEKKYEWLTPKFSAVVTLLNLKQKKTPSPESKPKPDDNKSPKTSFNHNYNIPEIRSQLVFPLEDETDISQDLSRDLSPAPSSNEMSQSQSNSHLPSNDLDDDPPSYSLASLPEIEEPKDDDDDYEEILNFPALTPDPLPSHSSKLLSPNKSPEGYNNRKRPRPYSSQCSFFQDNGEFSLLQVPSREQPFRRVSEPELPKLEPPKLVKTPPDESKYWAVRKNEPWVSFEKTTERIKSPLKKLKKIPENRSRSAIEKPTMFETLTKRERTISQPPLDNISPKRKSSLFDFRFTKVGAKVNPENLNVALLKHQKGIYSKINPKKPKNRIRNAKRSFLKRRNWVPVIKNILSGSFRSEKSAKVKPEITLSEADQRALFSKNDLHLSTASSSEYVHLVDYRNANFLPEVCYGSVVSGRKSYNRPMGADSRRRSPWVKFLRYWNIRRHFKSRRGRKNCKNKIDKGK